MGCVLRPGFDIDASSCDLGLHRKWVLPHLQCAHFHPSFGHFAIYIKSACRSINWTFYLTSPHGFLNRQIPFCMYGEPLFKLDVNLWHSIVCVRDLKQRSKLSCLNETHIWIVHSDRNVSGPVEEAKVGCATETSKLTWCTVFISYYWPFKHYEERQYA